jgi:hypothetical protein
MHSFQNYRRRRVMLIDLPRVKKKKWSEKKNRKQEEKQP